ncbi:thiamine phosphate synthase [Mangrovicoccus algicola]|uniref:thiamine phosphate synthase n=1 Tax=Mangrovicoccus algicola TaxID=2771008 RepID=UPI0038B39D8F
MDLSVYLVLDPGLCEAIGMAETAARAVTGGVTAVQLRDKTAGQAEFIAAGRAIKAALAGTGVPLIVNDNVAAAIEIGAEGLHLGQGDMPAHEARMRIGPDMILGISVETPDHAAAIDARLVDYVGAGPVFATATKPGHAAPTGLDGLAAIIAAAPVPAVAIGGVKRDHAAGAIAAGAAGIAVVSAICGRPDPARAARVLAHAVKKAKDT